MPNLKTTILATYRAKRAAFVRHTPFGILLADDQAALIKATARDCGVTVAEVEDCLAQELTRIKTAAIEAQRLWDLMTPETRRAALDLGRKFAMTERPHG